MTRNCSLHRTFRTPKAPRERLRALFLGQLEALLNLRSSEIAVVLSEWRQLSARSRKLVVKLRDKVDEAWDEVLREAAVQGIVLGDPRILRLSILGSINWSLQWYDRRGKLTIDDLAFRLLETFVPPERSSN